MNECKNLEHPTCLMRLLNEGANQGGVSRCSHCDTTSEELEKASQIDFRLQPTVELAAGQNAGNQKTVDYGGNGYQPLQIRCPGCGSQSDIADVSTLNNFSCTTCGEPIHIVDETIDIEPANRRLGHFNLVEQVGIGGFGVVWRAKDTELDRTVAIKIPRSDHLSTKEIDSFVHEARASAALNHPNIVSVHEIGRAEGSVYIVSDFVDGLTLEDYLSGKMLSPQEAATMCSTIAEALEHAHERGVVHRDLKPANIAVDNSLKPTIMDFGLALRAGTETTMTAEGKILGTPAYMSPEQARGESDSADQRSDIYSLGVVLFQMITGERPFRGNIRMLLKQIMHDEPVSPQRLNGAVPRDLATICLKCLQKEPQRRYQTAAAVKQDLACFLEGRPIAARPVSSMEHGWRWCRRNPVPAALTTALILSLMTGMTVSAWKWIEAESATTAAQTSADEANKSAKRSTDVLDIVTESFRSIDPNTGSNADMSAKDVLLQARKILAKSDLDDEGRMELLTRLGSTFFALTEYEESVDVREQLLELCKTHHGDSHIKTIEAMTDLGNSYRRVGKTTEAIQLQEESLSMFRAESEEKDERLIGKLNNLAMSYRQNGETPKAVTVFEEMVTLSEEVQGDDHVDTVSSKMQLATLLQEVGRAKEAVPLLIEAEEYFRMHFGADNLKRLATLNNLAYGKRMAGLSEEAIPILKEATQIMRKKFGDENANTLGMMKSLGLACCEADQSEQAISVFEETLGLHQAKYGEKNLFTNAIKRHLALAYELDGRLEDALPLLTEGLSIHEEIEGETWTFFTLQSQYGGVLLKLGKIEESSKLLLGSYDGMQRLAEKVNPNVVKQHMPQALNRLIELAEAQDDTDKVAHWKKLLGED